MVLIGRDNGNGNIYRTSEIRELRKDLKQRLKEKDFSNKNIIPIVKSLFIAAYIHREEKRKSGKNYIDHPYNTALTFIDLDVRDGRKLENIRTMLIMDSLLHDSPETLMEDNKGKTKEECLEYIIKDNKRFFPYSKQIKQDISDLTQIDKDYVAYIEGMKKNIKALLAKNADNRHNLRELKNYSPEEKLVPTLKGILVINTLKNYVKKHKMDKDYLKITKKVIEDSGDYAIMVLEGITNDIFNKYTKESDQEFKKDLATIFRKTAYVRWSTLSDFINIIKGKTDIDGYFGGYNVKEKDKEIYRIASFLKEEYSKLLNGGSYIKELEPRNLKKFEEKIKQPKELVYPVS